MPFGFYSLLEASILVLNAICILHEQRFLAKSCPNTLQCTFVVPLIGLNTILIIFKLIMG
ncbi:unnamed protein product [Mesocestoides corti]|uniref:Immediate early response 3-interacting protein 1 n=1 Tax=Mesocestoides corti TaxID=53468 RepID=A0A0R3UGW4_MESCO|nr:unnamed protein product [Mesocestoides corti]